MEHGCSVHDGHGGVPRGRALLSLAAALAVAGCAEGPAASRYPVSGGEPVSGAESAGAMVLEHHVSGAKTTLPELHGHVVLLNFWATWCRPCLMEVPVLAQVAADYGPKVLFVAVHYQDEASHRAEVTEWLAHQPEYFANQVSWGSPALHEAFPHRILPMTYVIGPGGKLVSKFRGAILGDRENELRAAIDRALAAPSAPEQ